MGVATATFTAADIAYVREGFAPLDELCEAAGEDVARVRSDIAAGRLPRPSYVLPDGAEMVPTTYFLLARDAGGADRLREHFLDRYRRAASDLGIAEAAEEEWTAYLSGEYGVCLREVTPETIATKGALIGRIESLLDEPLSDDDEWQSRLRAAVDELDAIERPFAPQYDRVRFGGPSSRDRLVTAVRKRYPHVFAVTANAQRA